VAVDSAGTCTVYGTATCARAGTVKNDGLTVIHAAFERGSVPGSP